MEKPEQNVAEEEVAVDAMRRRAFLRALAKIIEEEQQKASRLERQRVVSK